MIPGVYFSVSRLQLKTPNSPMLRKILNVIIELGMISLIVFPPIVFGAVWPKQIFYIQTIILAIGAVWTLKTFSRGSFYYPPDPLRLPMLCLIAWGVVNYFRSIYAHRTEAEIYLLAFYGLLFFVVLQQLKSVRRILGLAFILVLVGSGESLFGLFQYLNGATTVLGYATPNIGTVNATYFNHNHFAGFLILIIPVAFGLILSSASLEKRLFIFLLTGVMGTALVLSLSRGGLFSFLGACAIATFCLALKHSRRLRRNWLTYLVILLVFTTLIAGIIVMVRVSPIAHRSILHTFLPTRDAFENEIRFSIWRSALAIVEDFPFFGSGRGTFEYVFPRYQTLRIPQNTAAFHAHNDYIELLTDMGIPALLIVLWGIYSFLRYVLRGYFHHEDPVLTALALGGCSGIIAMLLHSFWDFNLQIPANALLFVIVLAMSVASIQIMEAGRSRKRRKHESSDHSVHARSDAKRSRTSTSYKASWFFLLLACCVLGGLGLHFRKHLALSYYGSARTLQNQQQFFPAIPWYQKALSLDRNNAMFYEELGQLYTEIARQTPHADKWYRLAMRQFQEAIALNRYYAPYHYQLAWTYAALNMEQEAIEQFRLAIDDDPKTAFYAEALGDYYLSLNTPQPAMELYRQALQYHPKRLHEIFERCLAYGLSYHDIRQIVPNVPEHRKRFAEVLEQKGLWDAGKTEYRHAIELSEGEKTYYEAMLEACRRKHDAPCQRELWQTLWEQSPDALDYPLKIAESFEHHQQNDKAVELYHQVLSANPEFEQGYLRLGALYQRLHLPSKAREIYMQLLARRPDDISVYHQFARLYNEQHDRSSAMKIYKQALQRGLADAEIHRRLGMLYADNGQHSAALRHYEEAVQQGSSDLSLYIQMERLYRERGDTISAEFVWEQYTQIHKHHPDALFKLVQYYHQQGEWLKAVTLVKVVISSAPTNMTYREFLAGLYEKEGMIEEAVVQYRRILRLQPQNTNAKRQLSRLEG
ncbi:hypothetical protein CSB45_05885 [candidate division KSB3 bacterium]|uniref:O-antigen ligase-related domain-containing protein n=1 Tax=candidate division KSB3 bacterium TaxID=2044937 RepID=A0A2G6E6T8_9BACT|nr:MAG: hypothetical protein CSB45_05885 [candidate division KSB3 bacterium]PIE30180.1 MAG: hypothetical protein CSA57_04605 [candidate division KSB3 bacterium]